MSVQPKSMHRRLFLAGLALVPATAWAGQAPCCGPVTAEGERLRHFLDMTGVDRLWLRGFRVNWQTGATIAAWPAGSGGHTHCSAFAASAAMRLGVYLLRPPAHGQALLANAQMGWLRGAAAAGDGWRPVADAGAAQADANRGMLAVAVFENPDPLRPGHIALIRPGSIDAEALARHGPMVTQAGGHNALSLSLARGFHDHPGAWLAGGGGAVRFFAHAVDWPRLPAAS